MTGFKLSLLSLFLLLVSCSGADQISDKIHPTIELDSSVSHTWVGYDNISKNDRQDFYYFSADFTVPEPPSNNTDTSLVLFIWPGIGNQGTDSRAKNILQPVLAWATPREKPTGWYLMNAWYSHNPQLDNQPVYKTSPTHAVSTGDKLTGKIQLCPTQYNNSGWTISFDNSSGEEISGITKNFTQEEVSNALGSSIQPSLQVMIEAYGANSSSDYPSSSTIFSNLEISDNYSSSLPSNFYTSGGWVEGVVGDLSDYIQIDLSNLRTISESEACGS